MSVQECEDRQQRGDEDRGQWDHDQERELEQELLGGPGMYLVFT